MGGGEAATHFSTNKLLIPEPNPKIKITSYYTLNQSQNQYLIL